MTDLGFGGATEQSIGEVHQCTERKLDWSPDCDSAECCKMANSNKMNEIVLEEVLEHSNTTSKTIQTQRYLDDGVRSRISWKGAQTEIWNHSVANLHSELKVSRRAANALIAFLRVSSIDLRHRFAAATLPPVTGRVVYVLDAAWSNASFTGLGALPSRNFWVRAEVAF